MGCRRLCVPAARLPCLCLLRLPLLAAIHTCGGPLGVSQCPAPGGFGTWTHVVEDLLLLTLCGCDSAADLWWEAVSRGSLHAPQGKASWLTALMASLEPQPAGKLLSSPFVAELEGGPPACVNLGLPWHEGHGLCLPAGLCLRVQPQHLFLSMVPLPGSCGGTSLPPEKASRRWLCGLFSWPLEPQGGQGEAEALAPPVPWEIAGQPPTCPTPSPVQRQYLRKARAVFQTLSGSCKVWLSIAGCTSCF